MSHYCDYEYELKSSFQMQQTSSVPMKNRWRVKLYLLREDGQWDDQGVGFLHFIGIC